MEKCNVIDRPIQLLQNNNLWIGRFEAMASDCEILMATSDKPLAEKLVTTASQEVWRIEQKFSRYRNDGIIPRINSSNGKAVEVDEETGQLLDFAYQCFELSDGLFDISSGVLCKAWDFSQTKNIPQQKDITRLLSAIGLNNAQWQKPLFSLPQGMQIDFGGIGKEYAVDKTLQLLTQIADIPLLVNYGGDINCNRSPSKDQPWRIGVEKPQLSSQIPDLIALKQGGLATSGSTHRYIVHQGNRYSHVLNPTTGWPVENPPLSITVAAANCSQAGMLATFSMLQGERAEEFLKQQEATYWVCWD